MASTSFTLLLLSAMAYVLIGSVASTEHLVGDQAGWTIPPDHDFYQVWANNKKFVVGDTLVFEYLTSVHNLLQVTKEEFDACTQQNAMAMYYKSPTAIHLKEPGDYYFYCGVGTHCEKGQKIHINVLPSSSQ